MSSPRESGPMAIAERSFVLGKVLQSISLYFAHWEDALIDKAELDEAFRELVEEALACDGRRAFSLLMMAFLARLNNGHTRFLDPALHEQPPLGLTLRPIEDRWTVLDSQVAGAQAGDVVLAIEGKPVETWFEELSVYAVGSSQSRTVQFGEPSPFFAPLPALFVPERYTVTLEDAQGHSHSLTVDRAALPPAPPAATEGRRLKEGLAYIRVPSFLDPAYEERAVAYVREFADADCLIIDVRSNHGGSTPQALTRALMTRPYRSWTESSPLHVGVLTYQAQFGHNAHMFTQTDLAWHAPASDPDPNAYQGRVLILVDRATYSAAEDFTMPFKDNGRAILVGETTGGSTGQPAYHAFENGLQFAIGTKRANLPDGTKFEGVGLVPDLHVVTRREDLYAGRDPVLEAASALGRRAEHAPPGGAGLCAGDSTAGVGGVSAITEAHNV
jgi:carboxyl-terminal processing protease